MAMNKRIKRLWIKALRSGKYEQGREALRMDGEFCCLGVLCDLHAREVNNLWRPAGVTRYSYHGASAELPSVVLRWAGLNDSNPMLGRKFSAAELNDQGKSFNFIADRIEKYL